MTSPLLQRAASLVDKISAAVLFQYKDPDGREFYLPKKMSTVRSPYSGKSFTVRPERVSLSDVGKDLKQDSKADDGVQKVKAGTLWEYTDDEGMKFYMPEKKTGTLKSPYSGKSFTAKPTRDTLGDVGKDLKELGKSGGPGGKAAEAPPKMADSMSLRTKYLFDSIGSSHEALRILDNEMAALEKDVKLLGSATPSAVTKVLKYIEKFRSLASPLAEALVAAEKSVQEVKTASGGDPWKVKPEFAKIPKTKRASDPEGIAAEFLEEGEAHPALQAIQTQYKAVVQATKTAKDTRDRLGKVAGEGNVKATDFMKPVIAEIKDLAAECATVASQLDKRTQR